MEQNNVDEIDLGAVFGLFKNAFNKLLVQVFKVIRFIIKNWIVVVILTIIGVGLGGYSDYNSKPNQEAKALIKINFDAVKYVYNEIDLLNSKFKLEDTIFLKEAGFRTDSLEIKELILTPNVSLKDIAEGGKKNKDLIQILDNFDLSEEDLQLSDPFISEYKHHTLEFKLSSNGSKETIEKVIDYINDNKILGEIKIATIENIKYRIDNNLKIIEQIDDVIETFQSGESLISPSSQIYVVDKNFSISEVFTSKVVLQQQTEELKNDLIYSKDIVVVINRPYLVDVDWGILGKKTVIYPLFLVLAFLLLSFVRNGYNRLKEIERNIEDK